MSGFEQPSFPRSAASTSGSARAGKARVDVAVELALADLLQIAAVGANGVQAAGGDERQLALVAGPGDAWVVGQEMGELMDRAVRDGGAPDVHRQAVRASGPG